MADVTLTYRGTTIAEMDASGNKTLKTSGKYCEGDIGVSYVKPSGGGGVEIPDSVFVISGIASYFDYSGKWDAFITAYADKWSTNKIESCSNMFSGTKLTSIPFTINLANGSFSAPNMFSNCTIKTLPEINGTNIKINSINAIFQNAYCLESIPDDYLNVIGVETYGNISTMFKDCSSLRNFPAFTGTLATMYSNRYTASLYYYMCTGCYVLDEITNLGVSTLPTWTGNAFISTLERCSRLKSFVFESGKSANWKNQTIDLSEYVGYANAAEQIKNHISTDKRVSDSESYAALKNDTDWWTTDIAYSRYNHDSAVATINSLPDTSAYLATAGGTNTIKFKGAAGSATDGGAINTLTEEKIAVATAKGWTVSLV